MDAPPPPRGGDCIRIVTFNVRYDNPDDGRNAWKYRKESAIHVMRSLNATAFGLQEALVNQVEDVASELPEFVWFGVGRNDGHRSGEYCPIFVNKSYSMSRLRGYLASNTPTAPAQSLTTRRCHVSAHGRS